MLATKLLTTQHRKAEALFRALAKKGADTGPLLEELTNGLSAHMLIEQEIFYPAVRDLAQPSWARR